MNIGIIKPKFTDHKSIAYCPVCGVGIWDDEYPEEILEQCPKCGILLDVSEIKNFINIKEK